MPIPRFAVWICSAGLMLLSAHGVYSQDYPNKPIRVVTGSPGSAAEFPLRVIAPGLTAAFGQPVVVDNRPSGMIPGDTVAKSKPDGYTLLVYGGTFWIGPLLEKAPYDPVRDFLPISLIERAALIVVVHPSVSANSIKELIALAKSRPGELSYGSSATGSTSHLAAELLKSITNTNIVRIPYKGNTAQITALISGEVPLSIIDAGLVAPYVKSGRLKALAITTAQPSVLFPRLPTVASTLPGYEAANLFAMFAPTKTPTTIINRMNQEVVRVLNTADVKEKFSNSGVEAVGGSPEELAIVMKADMARLGKVIQDRGIKAD